MEQGKVVIMEKHFNKIVVTGGAGTAAMYNLELLSNLILKRSFLSTAMKVNYFQNQLLREDQRYRPSFTDIRDANQLKYEFADADVIIHCAAFKNVPMCEASTFILRANKHTGHRKYN